VRITAQLVEAANGFQIWSETYDRNLKDKFATQGDIAREIAGALQLEFGTDSRDVRQEHQVDPDVYDRYSQARSLLYSRVLGALPKAAEAFEEVIAADPMFAEAYAASHIRIR